MFFMRLGFFITSVYGLTIFSLNLPVNDKSVLFIPFMAILFMFAGSAIGMKD